MKVPTTAQGYKRFEDKALGCPSHIHQLLQVLEVVIVCKILDLINFGLFRKVPKTDIHLAISNNLTLSI